MGGASPSAAHAQASQEALRALGFVPAALGQGECSRVQQAHQLGMTRPGRYGDHISDGDGSCLGAQRPVDAAVVQAIQLYLFWVSRRYLQQQHIRSGLGCGVASQFVRVECLSICHGHASAVASGCLAGQSCPSSAKETGVDLRYLASCLFKPSSSGPKFI